MATSFREIKRRIKSVKNIGQITKAMELVSAAKMRKAQSLATSSRPYAQLSAELLSGLAEKVDLTKQPLIHRPVREGQKPANKILVVLITADRGLAGAFNSNAVAKTLALLKEYSGMEAELITVGKKGADAIKRSGHNIIAAFPAKDKNISINDAKPIGQIAIEEFLHYRYDQVFLVYTDFVSTLVQRPNVIRILPVQTSIKKSDEDFTIEPNPEAVLDRLIAKTLEFSIYQALVETSASEQSARMVAMRNANSASKDLLDELTQTANQARQAGITRELAEISAAKLAMEG